MVSIFALSLLLLASGAAHAFIVDPVGEIAKEPVRVIVIDAGHGGKDSGAIGPGGTMEKDLTLAIALKLEKILRQKTFVKIFLTRRTDVYLTLDERTELANKYKADIFISVHINAARRRSARGVETYFLSFDASDDEARETAALENGAVRFGGATEDALIDDLKAILWDLTQTAAHRESSRLAETIYSSLFDLVGGEFRGVKQAPFIVLVGATMPAVLVEAGFISNPTEEKRLRTDRVQAKLAEAIADGVMVFGDKLKTGAEPLAVR